MKNIIFSIILMTVAATNAQQLESYQSQALQNNLQLQSLQQNVAIAREKINEMNSLPDTEFGAGYFVSEPETRTGAQKLRVSVRQGIPWFGTLQSRRDYAGSMVNVEEVNLEIAKRKLKLNVSQLYYELYELQEKQEVLQQNIDLLEVYRVMALNSIEVGQASAVEVLRLKMRQNDLLEKLQNLQLQMRSLKAQFNNLLNTSEETEINIQDTLVIPLEKEENFNLALNPELQQYDEFSESLELSEKVNLQEASPKLGFGLDYINVQKRTDMNMPDNGKDIVMPMVSISVPIFNNKYKSVTRQNELRQQEVEAQRSQRLNMLRSLFAEAQKYRNTARIQYNTQEQNLKQARDAESILLKNYETGTIDFSEVLDIQELQLTIQTKQIEAVQRYYGQAAILNYLIQF